MSQVALLFALLAVGCLTFYAWQNVRVRRMTRERLGTAAPEEAPEEAAAPAPTFVTHHYVLPWAAGLLVCVAAHYGFGLSGYFAVAFGALTGLIGGQLEGGRVANKTVKIEEQLADAIDLMIGTLHAGGGVAGALESATYESRAPLKPQLEEVIGRIRYGDDPAAVLHALEQRVPLETFRLFAEALSVHWEVGGSLAPTLAVVGKTVRDRIEIGRRIRTLTTQSRASIYAVMGVTYFLALIMWRNDPERMHGFLGTSVGQQLVAGAMLLQGVGIVWSAAVSRIKY